MSLNLMWQPVVPVAGHNLPNALRFVLRQNEEWSDYVGITVNHTADRDDIPYLKGLRDARVDGAQALIDAIEKYGVVRVYTEG